MRDYYTISADFISLVPGGNILLNVRDAVSVVVDPSSKNTRVYTRVCLSVQRVN